MSLDTRVQWVQFRKTITKKGLWINATICSRCEMSKRNWRSNDNRFETQTATIKWLNFLPPCQPQKVTRTHTWIISVKIHRPMSVLTHTFVTNLILRRPIETYASTLPNQYIQLSPSRIDRPYANKAHTLSESTYGWHPSKGYRGDLNYVLQISMPHSTQPATAAGPKCSSLATEASSPQHRKCEAPWLQDTIKRQTPPFQKGILHFIMFIRVFTISEAHKWIKLLTNSSGVGACVFGCPYGKHLICANAKLCFHLSRLALRRNNLAG